MKLALAVIALAATAADAGPARSPRVKTITIDYTYTSFHHNELHYVITAQPSGAFAFEEQIVEGPGRRGANDGRASAGSAAEPRHGTVDRAPIDALYAALTGLHAIDRVQRCMSHTDDYPAFKVTIDGERPIELASDSNCHLGVPWMVTEHGKLAAQYNGGVGLAVRKLLAAIDPEHWQSGPDSPEAFTGRGGEFVMLDEFTGVQKAGSPATACAKSLQTEPRIHAALGADIVVSRLTLGCDLTADSDCGGGGATASFRWEGVDLTYGFSCLNGHIDASAAVVADLIDGRAFLESKPMRTLESLASNPPRVARGDAWEVETWEDLPRLEYAPGRLVVRARARGRDPGAAGAAFWKALGIDPKSLTRDDMGMPETSATLDFAGKLIK